MLKILSRKNIEKLLRDPAHVLVKGRQKLQTQVAASCLRGRSFFPSNITFFLTYRCNLRCKVCGQWGENGYVKKHRPEMVADEMDLDRLRSIVDEIAPHRPQITLCGGEVLLYEKWHEFLCYVKAKGLTCVLTTNGTLLEENAEKLVGTGLDKISLSLDGPESIHNLARGSADGFQKAMRGLDALKRFKAAAGAVTPNVEIGCTISDQNYRHLSQVVDLAQSLEVGCLIFLHLCFVTDREFERQSALFESVFQTRSIHWEGYRYSPGNMNIELLTAEIERIKASKRSMPVIFHPDFDPEEMRAYYTHPTFLPSSYETSCLAPWSTVYVLPNGDVSPCSSYCAGNLKAQSFKEIWNGPRFRLFRNELRRRRHFPVCPRCCEFYKH